ncbi:GNAT family N-acetyltransferase [Deinococcus budaensis]|uniref:GNAT superfamily N-acetyltransferase n=1 Tax=Deinococcus budaensis TaxID=1665626 RepID=A0A7W8GIC6_9DEIO|nr:GNAT family N-acetyltransferase [Deinococcus budaensis]MBB5236199.1 GNAT superfamily N-acetyltransferase [Deinococcus budaensis]
MTTLSLPVAPFDPGSALPEARLAVGRLLADAYALAYPDDPPLLPEREALSLTHVTPDEAAAHFVVWDGQVLGERALGWGSLEYSLTQNRHAAHARLTVHPEARRRGLGRSLAHALREAARREGRRVVTFGTTDRAPAGEAFARSLGAEAALPMRQSRLDLEALSPELLDRWSTRPAGDPYRLHLWTRLPDEFLPRAADLMMVMNTAPKGELEMDDWTVTPEMIRAWETMIAESGEVRWLLAAEDTRTGELVGYTETFWTPERAALVYQGATAVRPQARGQGLGKWLKAAMLRHVQAACPGARWVRTNNADENAAMLGINVALGFVPWASFTEWQLRLA